MPFSVVEGDRYGAVRHRIITGVLFLLTMLDLYEKKVTGAEFSTISLLLSGPTRTFI